MPKFLGTITAPALASAPSVGVAGALYYNTTDNTLYKSNGTAWSAVGGSGGGFTISDTAPASPTSGQAWFKSDTGQSFVYYSTTWVEIAGGPAGPIGQSTIPWTKTGTLSVLTGSLRFPMPFDGTILGISARVGTAPTGADLIFDVNKNGTTIFTTQANRPKILATASATAAEVTNMDITSFVAGDYFTIDIDQVGSTVAGSDVTVVIRYRDAYGAVQYQPGMVLVNTTSFTTVSSFSINNCFTTTYDNYQLVFRVTGSASSDASIRLRSSATDATGTDYVYQLLSGNNTGISAGRTSAATAWRVGTMNTVPSDINIFMSSPALAAESRGFIMLGSGFASATIENSSLYHGLSTAYDGFTFYPASGTISGTVRVYGLRN